MEASNNLSSYYNLWTTTQGTGTWVSPSYSWVTYTQDKGEKAFNILKAMREAKLLKVTTIDEFINAMTLLMKEL